MLIYKNCENRKRFQCKSDVNHHEFSFIVFYNESVDAVYLFCRPLHNTYFSPKNTALTSLCPIFGLPSKEDQSIKRLLPPKVDLDEILIFLTHSIL